VANSLVLEVEISAPIRAGNISSIVLNTGERSSIRLFTRQDCLISATLEQHDVCVYRPDLLSPMPNLGADDVLDWNFSAKQRNSTLASDFEVRPLPDFAACPAGSIDAWVRQSQLTAAGPWSILRGIDCWASPMLFPTSFSTQPASSDLDNPVAASTAAFKIFVEKDALINAADQWLLRRSRCVIRDTKLLLEDGALLTTEGISIASYRAARLLTPRLSAVDQNSGHMPNTLFHHDKTISNLESE